MFQDYLNGFVEEMLSIMLTVRGMDLGCLRVFLLLQLVETQWVIGAIMLQEIPYFLFRMPLNLNG